MHVVEALLRGGDGGAQLGDLLVVLHEPQLGQVALEVRVVVERHVGLARGRSPRGRRVARPRSAPTSSTVGRAPTQNSPIAAFA